MPPPSEVELPVLICTGESSGEQHAAGLIAEIERRFPERRWRWFGSGGPRMAEAGVELLLDVSDLGAIGPWDALGHMGRYWTLFRRLLREAKLRRPRLAVLVDFPEFNLRLARRLKRLGIPVCYFIGPQVWAWRSSRVELLRRFVDLLLVIFPFEEEFYRSRGVTAHYVGNPTRTHLLRRRMAAVDGDGPTSADGGNGSSTIALLPGSRSQEVARILPLQLDSAAWLARRHPCRFWVLRAPSISTRSVRSIYDSWLARGNAPLRLEIREEGVERLLPKADCAIIKSGTSTLEAMLLETPFAMVYRISPVSWFLARPLVRTRTYCLANLVAGRRIVPEFVQREADPERIGRFLLDLLEKPTRRAEMRNVLRSAASELGESDAYEEGARRIGAFLFPDEVLS